MADLLYVRLIGYFNGDDSTGHGVADLAEAIVTLDPRFRRAYDHAANAMTLAKSGVDQGVLLRAVALLEAGRREFPEDYRFPFLAGQIYTQDLKTDDPALRRTWDEKGALLIERATRMPGAPAGAASWAAIMRSKLGQHERAVTNLREMLLTTNDDSARKKLIAALARIEERDANSVDADIQAHAEKFTKRWDAQRPPGPPTRFGPPGPTCCAVEPDAVETITPSRKYLTPVGTSMPSSSSIIRNGAPAAMTASLSAVA